MNTTALEFIFFALIFLLGVRAEYINRKKVDLGLKPGIKKSRGLLFYLFGDRNA